MLNVGEKDEAVEVLAEFSRQIESGAAFKADEIFTREKLKEAGRTEEADLMEDFCRATLLIVIVSIHE
ncbi:hypothetical protein MHYP_G00032890 [Metynnis hypsauchen]